MMSSILKSTYDLHIHAGPDVISRKCDDREVAKRMSLAGMCGGIIKCHFFETAARAALIRKEFPDLEVFGGIALNNSVGGSNPAAVEKTAKMGGAIIWFPTMDARAFQTYKHRGDTAFDGSQLLIASNGAVDLLPETKEVLSLAAQYDLIVATGHLSPEEGMMVIREGKKQGVRRMVLTHVEHPAVAYTDELRQEAVSLGAYIEHSYNNVWFGRCTLEEMARQIRVVGCDHVILSSDFGQPEAPYFDAGMEECAGKLELLGFTMPELKTKMSENPAALLRDRNALHLPPSHP